MKILRPVGPSFTEFATINGERKLARGVRLKPSDERVRPDALTAHVSQDSKLRIRQVISVLDKVIRKPGKLTAFCIEAFKDRVLLEEALWDKLGLDVELREVWLAKAHPYAVSKAVRENSRKIIAAQKAATKRGKQAKRADFEGRWHRTLWKINMANGAADFEATAIAILEHLDEQEQKLGPEGDTARKRGRSPGVTGKGLLKARGNTIVASVNDPREQRKPRNGAVQWDSAVVSKYFKFDIAKCIFDLFSNQKQGDTSINAAYIGEGLYRHFGHLGEVAPSRELWSLHNHVREFYRKLLKSQRFIRAQKFSLARIDEDCPERQKLLNLFPQNKDELLAVLKAKDANADVSELIRLGKLVIHTTDMELPECDGEGMSTDKLKAELDRLACSDGQSEIKRNESFVRVWRNATGISAQTLRTITGHSEDDVFENETMVRVASDETLTSTALASRLALLFGAKLIEGTSRASLFDTSGGKEAKEVAWGLLALGASVRHKTNHFMVKSRLEDMAEKGILWTTDDSIANRRSNQAASTFIDRLTCLLQFDQKLRISMIADELKALKADLFLTGDQANALATQLIAQESGLGVIVPRFMAVMRKAQNVQGHGSTDWKPPLAQISKVTLKNTKEQSDRDLCLLGILRLLYNTGFQVWLQVDGVNGEALAKLVTNIINAKLARADKIAKEEKRVYRNVESLLGSWKLESYDSLDGLFSKLMEMSAHESGNSRRYEAEKASQSAGGSAIEGFKQELTAAMFEHYLGAKELTWIWSLPDSAAQATLFSVDQIHASLDQNQLSLSDSSPAAAQFYAWLYFLPPDTVALLRHQFRKTLVLEGKAGAAPSVTLKVLDRLMALYTTVQGAGFAGTEVDAKVVAGVFYAEPGQFQKVMDAQNHDSTIAGTQRGLRELLRFGHIEVMKAVFEHPEIKVSADEVNRLTDKSKREETMKLFQDKNQLHDDLVAIYEAKRKIDEAEVTKKCADYKIKVEETQKYNHAVRAARLEEHVRAHQVMMKVVGRLLDFTLMWERDAIYAAMGILYREWRDVGRIIGLCVKVANDRKEGKVVSLCLPAQGERVPAINIKLWTNKSGFSEGFLKKHAFELMKNGENRALYKRLFMDKTVHLKDAGWKEAPKQKAAKGKGGSYLNGPKQIRNDFAHYNVINRSGETGVDLTKATNAVRSLFGYDRKLKNAVSKAVIDLLSREGLAINWAMERDRLIKPEINSGKAEHLTFVKGSKDLKLKLKACGALVPLETDLCSPKFVFMARLLFGGTATEPDSPSVAP